MIEKKSSKRYIIVFAVVALLGIITMAGLTFVMDPLFQYHMPWFGKKVYADDERYQNPGLAKNADYDTVIVGSSMSENFNCEWFDEAYNVNTLKLTYSGCSAQDWVNAVTMAEENQDVKYVFGNIDAGILTQEYGKTRSELPEYLYDKNYFNDINYLLNKDIFFNRTINMLQDKNVENLKNAYSWYDSCKDYFNHHSVIDLVRYAGECGKIQQKNTPINANTIEVVKQIKETILRYPDTTFELFYSPYSILCWYPVALSGELNNIMASYEYSMKELLECENCKLYFPSYNNIEMISDLDKYKDQGHYDMDIQYTIFDEMSNGVNKLTKEQYIDVINWFKDEIMNYNYQELYEKYE